MKKVILALSLIFTMAVMGACSGIQKASGAETKTGKVLTVGTSADFPPFETRDTSGNIVGFDIDLGNYIAKKLGYKLEIQRYEF